MRKWTKCMASVAMAAAMLLTTAGAGSVIDKVSDHSRAGTMYLYSRNQPTSQTEWKIVKEY